MASEPDQHSSAASFYESPQEARHARPEEFLYLACLHEGTGVRRSPTSSPWSMPRTAGVVHETPMPNVGDELHHFGWNRCSSACHGPDRSHLIVPGFRSSRIHVLNVADDPRRPRIEKVIEPRGAGRQDRATRGRTPCTACRATTSSSACSATRDGGGAGGFAVLDARTFEVKGRWENGGATPALQLRLLVPAAPERARLIGVRRAQRLRDGLRPRRRRRRALRQPAALLEPGRTPRRADARARRDGAHPARGALAARPRRRRGLRRRGAVEHDVALPPRQRLLQRPTR